MDSTQTTFPEHMTIPQAAEYLKLSESTVRAYIKKGYIPFWQAFTGSRITLKKSILDAWVEDATLDKWVENIEQRKSQ